MYTTVKIRIDWQNFSENRRSRLRKIIARDGRIINRYLGVIEANEKILVSKKRKYKIDKSILHRLTYSTTDRPVVKHDLKNQFKRISPDELNECRDVACEMYLSYLETKDKRKATRPKMRKIATRRMSHRKFNLDLSNKEISIIDSRDSNLHKVLACKKSIRHDYLTIPLILVDYHVQKLRNSKLVCLTIHRSQREYYCSITINLDVAEIMPNNNGAFGIVGIDLGINKLATTALVAKNGVIESKVFDDKERFVSYLKVEKMIKKLLHKSTEVERSDNVFRKLKSIRNLRSNIKLDIDRQVSARLAGYIYKLSFKYNIYVAIGNLKGIRLNNKRGNGKKQLRKKVHRWSYFRFTSQLQHNLNKIGLGSRLIPVKENWTSIMCHRCNQKGIRPRQDLFICQNQSCRWKGNADLNGAVNIAKRAIMYFRLVNKSDYGHFNIRAN